MKSIFLDTEFTGLHQHSTLISLALVAESGEEFYAELTDYDTSQLSDWLKTNVLHHLFLKESYTTDSRNYRLLGDSSALKSALTEWFDQFPKVYNSEGKVVPDIQIWADCYAWDWVLFCEIFGGAFGIPSNIHYMPMDLATLFQVKTGVPDAPRFAFVAEKIAGKGWVQHNALYDARVELECYQKLMGDE